MGSKKRKKFYVVWKGKNEGIYPDWEKCKQQVLGVPGAKYAGFYTLEDANLAFQSEPPNYSPKPQRNSLYSERFKAETIKPEEQVLLVDAACSGNPGVMEYRGMLSESKKILFHQGPFQEATNNVGEFLAIVHALAWLDREEKKMDVYSDSSVAILWVKKKKVGSKLKRTEKNIYVFELIYRALRWLQEHPDHCPVKKWNTAEWGEIPADFGRKD